MKKRVKKRIRRIFFLTVFVAVIAGMVLLGINYLKESEKAKNPVGENKNDNIIQQNDENLDKNNDTDDNEQNKSNQSSNEENEKKEDINITLTAVGDIMFHPKEIKGGYDEVTGTYDYTAYFQHVKPIIEKADIAVANFEGTTCGDDLYAYQGYPLFNAPDEVLDAIKDTGFDLLSTINNHSLDTRKTGVIRTIEKIKARGMEQVGTYVEKPESRIVIMNVKGIKIAFLAYTEMLNGLDSVLSEEDLDTMINKIDRDKIKEDIADAKEQNADLIVMMVHWGDEYQNNPNSRQKDLADFLLSEGVNIILGSHPHVVQECTGILYNDKKAYIAYSMGNFISNQRTEEELPPQTEDGVIISINIKKSGETGETTIEGVEYTPTWVFRGRELGETKYTYRILPVMDYIESEDYSEDSKERMKRSYNDTMSKLDASFN